MKNWQCYISHTHGLVNAIDEGRWTYRTYGYVDDLFLGAVESIGAATPEVMNDEKIRYKVPTYMGI